MEQSKKNSISPGEKNNALLKYISTDIISIKRDVQTIKSDLTIIKEYIEKKKEREENKWFY